MEKYEDVLAVRASARTKARIRQLQTLHEHCGAFSGALTIYVDTSVDVSDSEDLDVYVHLDKDIKACARLSRKALAALGAAIEERSLDAIEAYDMRHMDDEPGDDAGPDSLAPVSPLDFDPTGSWFMSPALRVCLEKD